MKKAFTVKGLDCPHCAQKLEKGINKIEDVDVAVVSFATGKLVLEADDDKFEAVVEEACRVCKELEPEWEIVR